MADIPKCLSALRVKYVNLEDAYSAANGRHTHILMENLRKLKVGRVDVCK